MRCLEQKLMGVITNNAPTMNGNKTYRMGEVKEELNQKDLHLTQTFKALALINQFKSMNM
jgi:hypothetical protein